MVPINEELRQSRQKECAGRLPSDARTSVPELDFLEVGDLQVIRERLETYRSTYGDAPVVRDLTWLLDRLERAAGLVFSLIDHSSPAPRDR